MISIGLVVVAIVALIVCLFILSLLVSFAKYWKNSSNDMDDFVSEVLEEIPVQLLDYMRRNYIVPGKSKE